MCVVSMIGDHYGEKIPMVYPWAVQPNSPNLVYPVSREEFDALRKDVQEMKELLLKAKAYDEANGEPDCAMEEKVELLKRIAELVGVDLTEVFGSDQ